MAFTDLGNSRLTNGLSHHLEGNNIHFAYGKWTKPIPGAPVEPFVLWRVGRGTGDALSGITQLSRVVSDFRFLSPLPDHWDYSTEWAVQSGSVVDSFGKESIHAFAQHSGLCHTFEGLRIRPRAYGEFNYASGDKDPYDHRRGTFDLLFPTANENTAWPIRSIGRT